MNRKNIIIISILACLITLIVVFISHSFSNNCKETDKYQNNINENVNLTIKFDRLLDNNEYEDFSAYIKQIADVPDEFNRIAKLTINFNNKSDYSLYGFISSIDNKNLFMVPECVDIESSEIIFAKSNIELNMYVYISDDLSNKQDVENALKNVDFNFLFFIDNTSKPMEPYKVEIKAKWDNNLS